MTSNLNLKAVQNKKFANHNYSVLLLLMFASPSELFNMKDQKRNVLFLVLGAFFIANAIIAEFIGVKIFSVEGTLGIKPFNINLLGDTYSFNMTAGVLLWPMVFVMTDIINEYFGKKGVRFFSYLAAFLITYAFVMVYASIKTVPAQFFT